MELIGCDCAEIVFRGLRFWSMARISIRTEDTVEERQPIMSVHSDALQEPDTHMVDDSEDDSAADFQDEALDDPISPARGRESSSPLEQPGKDQRSARGSAPESGVSTAQVDLLLGRIEDMQASMTQMMQEMAKLRSDAEQDRRVARESATPSRPPAENYEIMITAFKEIGTKNEEIARLRLENDNLKREVDDLKAQQRESAPEPMHTFTTTTTTVPLHPIETEQAQPEVTFQTVENAPARGRGRSSSVAPSDSAPNSSRARSKSATGKGRRMSSAGELSPPRKKSRASEPLSRPRGDTGSPGTSLPKAIPAQDRQAVSTAFMGSASDHRNVQTEATKSTIPNRPGTSNGSQSSNPELSNRAGTASGTQALNSRQTTLAAPAGHSSSHRNTQIKDSVKSAMPSRLRTSSGYHAPNPAQKLPAHRQPDQSNLQVQWQPQYNPTRDQSQGSSLTKAAVSTALATGNKPATIATDTTRQRRKSQVIARDLLAQQAMEREEWEASGMQ